MQLNHSDSFKNTLKEKTLVYHQRLESQVNLTRSTLTLSEYKNTLKMFYGYIFPLESKVKSLPYTLAHDYNMRGHLLFEDLISLQTLHASSEEVTIPLCQELPQISTLGDVYGCLYVLEGSKLGNIIISNHLKRNLFINAKNGGSYFHSVPQKTWEGWADFCRDLENYVHHNPEAKHNIIKTAQQTFINFERWLLT